MLMTTAQNIPEDANLGRFANQVHGSKLKVCIASMAPFVGGAEVAAERLALGLLAEGHKVLMLLGRPGPVQERCEKANLRCLVSPMYFTDKWHYPRYWLARRRLRRILQTEKPDVVHSNDLPTHQIISDAARTAGVPCICHHRFPFPQQAIDWLNKFGAERHLFVSSALMQEMSEQSTGLRGSRRAVVYDGLSMPLLPDASRRQEARESLGLPGDKVIAMIAGQVIERKGVADLIEAWALLDAEVGARAHLVIVGDDLAGQGAYRREMEQLAAQRGVPARFAGFQKAVAEWLRAVDFAVVPSHVEPLGNSTLEAMSFAQPVIGTRAGGIPEMIVHEKTGLLVEAKNPGQLSRALSLLIKNPGLRQSLGQAGRRRCEDMFSLQKHAREVLVQYHLALCADEPANSR
jgi:glycosyltransferase involved in cell wall biosynthesis